MASHLNPPARGEIAGTKYVIEPAIPIPPQHRPRPLKYPFDKMKVGDSILFKVTPEHFHKIRGCATGYGARCKPKKHFVGRQVGEGEFRIWLKSEGKAAQ